MSAPIPTTEPAVLRAGDTAAWLLTLPEFPAGSGWSLEYTMINAGGKIAITSTPQGDAHSVRVLPATTALWSAGTYAWQCRVSNGTDAYTIGTGSIEIKPDLAGLAASDQRSHADKVLAKIETWLETRDPAVAEYEIAGRRMKYIPIAELLALRDRYRRDVRGQSGKSGRIYLRF